LKYILQALDVFEGKISLLELLNMPLSFVDNLLDSKRELMEEKNKQKKEK